MALTQKAEQLLELPQGMLSGDVHIEIDGRHHVTVTGSCDIREYESDIVRLNTRSGEVRLNGDTLVLDALHNGGITVRGQILSVEFL